MAGDERVTIQVDADAQPAVAELRKLGTQSGKTAAALDRIGDSAAKAAKKGRTFADQLGDVNKVSAVTNGAFSDVTGPLDDFGDLIERVGGRQAALMAGTALLGAAVVGVGVKALDAVRNWSAYEQAAGGATAQTLAMRPAVDSAAASLASLDQQAARLSLSFGAALAPAIDGAAGALGGYVALISDATFGVTEHADSVFEAATSRVSFTSAVASMANAIPGGAAAVGLLTAAYKGLTWYGDRRAQQLEDERFELARVTAESARRADAARGEAQALAALLGVPDQEPIAQSAEEKRLAAEAERAAAEAARERAAAEREKAQALKEATQEEDKQIEAFVKRSAAMTALAARHVGGEFAEDPSITRNEEVINESLQATLAARNDFEMSTVESAKKTAQQWSQQWGGAISTVGSYFSGFARAVADVGVYIVERTEGDTKRAKRKQFKIQQAAAIAEATIATLAGVVQALGSSAPPMNFVLAALTGAAGAVQIGLIASKQPTFHRGGILPDEQRAPVPSYIRRSNETTAEITAQGMRAMGGQEGLARLNAGTPPPMQPIYLVVDGQPRRARMHAGPDVGYGIRGG